MHPDQRDALLLVGMHRSGTSAAALAFEQLGWHTGRDRLETRVEVNRDGFGENRAVVEFNEALLAHHGGRWFQLTEIPAGWADSEDAAGFIDRAVTLLEEQFADSARILLKDPRLCLSLPVWLRALARAGYRCRVVLQFREPGAVAASLERRDSLPPAAGEMLWLHYTLAAERHSRDCERAWLFYDDLLERGGAALTLFPDLDVPAGKDLGIDPALAHHDADEGPAGYGISALCRRVWEAARDRSEADPVPQPGGSELVEAFDALTAAVIERAAAAVQVGEQHRDALATIAIKDRQIVESSNYAAQCEAVVAEKDREITEVADYARECEAVIAQKDREIGEVTDYARECEAVVAQKDSEIAEVNGTVQQRETEIIQVRQELTRLRGQFLYRMLRKLRLVE